MKSTQNHQGPPFELIAGNPVLDLVNTLEWRFRDSGPEELLESYRDLLRFTEQSKLLTSPQSRHLEQTISTRSGARVLESCAALREALAEILYALLDGNDPPATSIKILDEHAKQAHLHQRLSWNNSRAEWSWSAVESKAELPLWLLAQRASDLITSDALHLVRACGDPACRWLFLDTSKNHTRRWCDMKICGNRMKARRFKAQHVT